MYRFETSYDLLITSRALVTEDGIPKPKLETKLIFSPSIRSSRPGAVGQGQDVPWSGCTAVLHVDGSEAGVPLVYQQAVFKMTEAVTGTKCKHQHLLKPPSLEVSVADLESVNVSAAVA